MKKWITGMVLMIWMTVIFLFSAQTGNDSSEVSHSAAYQIVKWQDQLFQQDKTEKELVRQAEALQLVVRKGAHMSEYALLAILLVLHLDCYHFNKKQVLLSSWILTTCYAVSDEFHQLFVPGRAGRFTDVCIDSAGGLLGIAWIALLWKRLCVRREKDPIRSGTD